MNFGMLKNMVENLISSYSCPFCNGRNIGEQHIDIVGAAGNTVNIDMHCPGCDKHFMVKTEVVQVELGGVAANKIEKIKNSLNALKGKMGGNLDINSIGTGDIDLLQETTIRDKEISDLHKDLQQEGINVNDLFSDES